MAKRVDLGLTGAVRRVLLGLLALSLTIGSLAAPSAGVAAKKKSCRQAGSKTVVATKSVRVFDYRGRTYGCLHRRGVRVALDSDDPYGDSRLSTLKPRIAGRFVGYAHFWDNGVAGGPGVGVTDLQRGTARLVDFDPSTERDHPDGSVEDLVVTTRGSLAWTMKAEYGLDVETARRTHEVRTLDVSDRAAPFGIGTLVAEGAGIDVLSLERRGSAVTWLESGALMSQPLR